MAAGWRFRYVRVSVRWGECEGLVRLRDRFKGKCRVSVISMVTVWLRAKARPQLAHCCELPGTLMVAMAKDCTGSCSELLYLYSWRAAADYPRPLYWYQ